MLDLTGFLAPDGSFEACDTMEHATTAAKIVKKYFPDEKMPFIMCEDRLYRGGWVIFRSQTVEFGQMWMGGKQSCMNLLTDDQKFALNSFLDVKEEYWKHQIEDIERILESDKVNVRHIFEKDPYYKDIKVYKGGKICNSQ